MASAEVAAGDGALRTCISRGPCTLKLKSSSRPPSSATDCARTPEGPGTTSAGVSSGMNRWQAATKARLDKSRKISAMPVRQYLRASRRKPG
jgi:hypothetical protein